MMSLFARLCRSAVLVLSATATASAPAQQTLRVPGDFPTVQGAIDAASTGDTVSVGPGTYFVNLVIDTKEINLVSTGGAATTTLDGQHLGPVLKITNTPGNRTTVSGFTLQNGSPLGSMPGTVSVGPAGILIAGAGAQITDSTFQKNSGINVGVINGSLSLKNSSVSTAPAAGTGCSGSLLNPATGVYLSGTSTVLTGTGTPAPTILSGNTIFGDGTRCSGLGVQASRLGQALTLQKNTIRNNAVGIVAQATDLLNSQNLIYDNANGALSLLAPSASPNVDPATTVLVNNTVVNNLTSPDLTSTVTPTDIFLDGTVARTEFVNNILVGTTPHPVLTCATASPSLNDTPLIFDHNDLYNTTNAPNGLATGDCFPGLGSPLTGNGNLSLDPRLAGSTDLHPQSMSPVIDAGTDSAPGIVPLGSDPLITDLDGNSRVVDSTAIGYSVVDLGAYEQQLGDNSITFSSTALTASAYDTTVGSVTLTASVTAASIYFGNLRPSGTITFYQDGRSLGQVSLPYQGSATLQVPLTTPGLFGFTASFFPPESVGPSQSLVIYVRVTSAPPPATTTLTLATSPSTQVLNQPVTLSLHLGSLLAGSASAPGPVPPGAVTLSDNGTLLSTLQPDSSGAATYTIPSPTLGNHTFTAAYAGTSLYSAASTSTGILITAPIATTLSATASPNPAPFGTAVACTATVIAATGPAPTGTVVFTDGSSPAGTVRLTSPGEQGIATVNLGPLSIGLHTLTVTFQPDPGFSPSTGSCTVNVGGDATSTTLVSAKNPALTTDLVSYTVTVANTSGSTTAPGGSVTLSEGNTLLASAPLLPGALAGSSSASLPVTLGSTGLHLLTATYLPATAATFTSSAHLSETIAAPPAITTLLSASPASATLGQIVTLSASLASTAPLPASAVITFLDGASTLGSVPVTGGIATLPVSTLSIGTHQLSAVLHTAADASTIRSTSNALTVSISGLTASLSLSSTPASSVYVTTPVTFFATLTPASTPPSTGSSLSGSVTFFDNGLVLGNGSLSPEGYATLTTTALSAGTHSITAGFSGNAVFAAATSPALAETVSLNPSTVQLLAPAQAIAFAPLTLSARVASSTTPSPVNAVACTPACAPVVVTFFADTASGRSPLGTVPVDAAGRASLTFSPAAGILTLSAVFSGSATVSGSTSPSATLAIAPAVTGLVLSANPNPVYQHGVVTLSANLQAAGVPAAALTGSVTFLEGSTTLGVAPLAAITSVTWTPGSVGTHTVTAIFSGTGSLIGSSATATITVLPSDFTLSVKDINLTIATTHHAPTTVTVQATGALADQVDLACSNLPEFASCTFSPATHDLSQNPASTGTLMLDTDALLNYAAARSPGSGRPSALTALLAMSLPTTLLAGLLRLRRRGSPSPARSRLPQLLAALLLSVGALAVSGCSGKYPSHVVPGTYTITVTGHARATGVQHTTQLTLIVTQ